MPVLQNRFFTAMRKTKHLIFGVLLMLIGIGLWVLPVLPGFVLAIVGYLLIGIHYPKLLVPLDALARKNKRVETLYQSAKAKLTNFL